ncbi:L-2-hydroxyglutarate oxidase [Brucellaceae bacterium C25G]
MKYDIVVIGAGIIGLATTYHLKKNRPDLKILVLEKENAPGLHQTGHNSGVIHAGIYYAPGSLKARLCKAGVQQTKQFCDENDISYDVCGKLIIATDDTELEKLENLRVRAETNQLDIRIVDANELKELEPNVTGVKAILSPASGIVDYGQICRVLRDKLIDQGVEFSFQTEVTDLIESSDEIAIKTTSGDFIAKMAVSCSGLQADRLAAMSGLADDFRIIPFRGEYYRLAEHTGNLVNHLIYPVPDPSLPFLGVHLTKMIGGYTTVGPNAVFSFGRETYERNEINFNDALRSFSFPGFWKLMLKSIKPGIHELQGTLFKSTYLERCRRYCPSLTLEDLQSYPSGIRAQAVGRDGKMIDDFLLRQSNRAIHVCNAPSPAATSAFPIGAELCQQILERQSV